MFTKRTLIVTLLCAAAVTGASLVVSRRPTWGVSRSYPPINVPADNPMSDQKVTLGRWLFYDRRLSFNNSIACADCHRQAFAFSDPRPRSIGATGEQTVRNAMTLTNVAYNGRYTWANDRLKTLEQQALVPLTQKHPLEMGMLENKSGIMNRFRADSQYVELFRAAFPSEKDGIRLENVVKAISSFVRTLISVNAPFDRFLVGDKTAMSESAQRGFQLFRSTQLKCARCHDGFNFRMTSGHRTSKDDDSVAYHNTGLYNLRHNGSYPATDRGLLDVTGDPGDMGRFKAPTLRNVAVTAPYMHDGSVATLEEVVANYAAGGRVIAAGLNAGDGRLNPFKNELITGFDITPEETHDLIEFLRSLTDRTFLANPSLANPSRERSE